MPLSRPRPNPGRVFLATSTCGTVRRDISLDGTSRKVANWRETGGWLGMDDRLTTAVAVILGALIPAAVAIILLLWFR